MIWGVMTFDKGAKTGELIEAARRAFEARFGVVATHAEIHREADLEDGDAPGLVVMRSGFVRPHTVVVGVEQAEVNHLEDKEN